MPFIFSTTHLGYVFEVLHKGGLKFDWNWFEWIESRIDLDFALQLLYGGDSPAKEKMGCANGKQVLTDDDLNYIASHTAVSREEVDERYSNFLARHPDGKITKKEFRGMMQACYPGADTDKLEKHIFRMYDANGDGFIDFREFMLVLYVLSSGTPEANLKQIFRIFDINNDGSISQKEMTRIVKDLFHLLSKDEQHRAEGNLAQLAFKEMDVNDDGRVTLQEFIDACLAQEKISSMLALKFVDVFI